MLIFSSGAYALDVKDFDNLKLIGKTPLKFIGIKLYDIEVRAQGEKFSYDQKFIIKIDYVKNFSKEELVDTSISEIARINDLDEDEVDKEYRGYFEELFVDVKKGDEKIAFYDPKFGLKLFYNGKLIGAVKDVVFAKRFVDIWLSDKARFKKVRDRLVGVN